MRQEARLPNEGFVCRFSFGVASPPSASAGRLLPGCQIGRFCCFPAFAGRAAGCSGPRPIASVADCYLPEDRFGILISGVCSVGRVGRVWNECNPQLGRSRTGEELGGHGLCPRFSSLPAPRPRHAAVMAASGHSVEPIQVSASKCDEAGRRALFFFLFPLQTAPKKKC